MVLTNDPLHNIFRSTIDNIVNEYRFETNQLVDYAFNEFNKTVNQIYEHIHNVSKVSDENQYYSTFGEAIDPNAAKFITSLRNKRKVHNKSLRGNNKQKALKK